MVFVASWTSHLYDSRMELLENYVWAKQTDIKDKKYPKMGHNSHPFDVWPIIVESEFSSDKLKKNIFVTCGAEFAYPSWAKSKLHNTELRGQF